MKASINILLLLIILSGISCGKYNNEAHPGDIPGEKKWVVTTIAGNGIAGLMDGPALSAQFSSPQDVVVAADGTVYVTDMYNSRIRRIRDGQVSTFAGSDSGFLNGIGISAKFTYPYSIAFDADENMFVSDVIDGLIRKITPAAEVTTFNLNYNEFPQYFILVQGMIADSRGNFYVSDTYNQRIRKINNSGLVTTLAGNDSAGFRNSIGTAAKFNHPSGIVIDKQENLYVPDPYNFRIRKISPGGQVSTFAGSGEFGSNKDGDAATARFRFPVDIVMDSLGNFYVADDSRIRKITPQGEVSTIAGSTSGFRDGDGTSAQFSTPSGLGIDAKGNIYVADTYNHCVRKISYE